MSWEHSSHGGDGRADIFGPLEGITSTGDGDHPSQARPVPALMIFHLLTADTG